MSGLIFYRKYKFIAAKFFVWFLIYIAICDGLSMSYNSFVKNGFLNFIDGTIIEKNFWWSTVYWKIGAILFFVFYYQKILKNRRDKNIIKWAGGIFLIVSIAYIVSYFQDLFVRSLPFINILGALVILLCVILYFIEILQSEKVLTFYKSLNFYISSSILIWWLIITPLVFYDIYFSTSDWDFVFLKWQIYLFANIFMYTTFTVGLIVSKTDRKQVVNE